MLVRNVEARLIRVGGEFIAPNQEVDITDDAVGLVDLIARGVLVEVVPLAENLKKDSKGKKQE